MSRSKRYIEVEGILARDVLGTFTIIRSFATLQELAEMSAPHFMREVPGKGFVEGSQRPLDPHHAEDVKRHFEDGDRRFIPEVVLSVRAARTDEMKDGPPVGVSVVAAGGHRRRLHFRKRAIPPLGANSVISETPAMRSGLDLIERLTVFCCKYLIFSRFLFE